MHVSTTLFCTSEVLQGNKTKEQLRLKRQPTWLICICYRSRSLTVEVFFSLKGSFYFLTCIVFCIERWGQWSSHIPVAWRKIRSDGKLLRNLAIWILVILVKMLWISYEHEEKIPETLLERNPVRNTWELQHLRVTPVMCVMELQHTDEEYKR